MVRYQSPVGHSGRSPAMLVGGWPSTPGGSPAFRAAESGQAAAGPHEHGGAWSARPTPAATGSPASGNLDCGQASGFSCLHLPGNSLLSPRKIHSENCTRLGSGDSQLRPRASWFCPLDSAALPSAVPGTDFSPER